jgi:carbon storage regulator CsrA
MLVLSRGEGTAIHIGPDITVHVIELHAGYVVMGIDAPRSVPVVRDDAQVKEPKKEGKPNG